MTTGTQIAFSAFGAVVGGVIGGYPGAMIGLSIGGYVGRMVDPPNAPKPPPLGNITLNSYNRNLPLGLCYGQCKCGGGVIMVGPANTDVDNEGSSKNPEYTVKMTLYWAVAHCEGPVALADPPRWWIGDKIAPLTGDSNFSFLFYPGSSNQTADPYFLNVFSGTITVPNLKYTAWTRCYAHVEGSYLTVIPNMAAELRGFLTISGEFEANTMRVIYDFLTNKRYGVGLEPDMFNGDPDTVGSPWKTESDYCDELVTYYDKNGVAQQEPRFRYSRYIDSAIKAYDLLTDALSSCRGLLRYKNGKLEPLIEHGQSVPEYYYSDRLKMSFTTGGGSGASRIYADLSANPDIFWRGATGRIVHPSGGWAEFAVKDSTTTYVDLCEDLDFSPGGGVAFTLTKDNIKEGSFNYRQLADNEIFNYIRVEFQRRSVFDIETQEYVNEYQWDAIEQEVPELFVYTETSSQIRQTLKKIKTVRMEGIKRPTQAMRMAQFLGDAVYYSRNLCSFVTGHEGYQHAIGDIIGVSHAQTGWIRKQFQVIKLDEQENDEVQIDCIEYNPNIYGDEVSVNNFDPDYNDQGGSPWTAPAHVERFSMAQDPSSYTVYFFFKRPDDSSYWYGARCYVQDIYFMGIFSITTPSVLLSSFINETQTTIPFDPASLYGSFPSSGDIFINLEKIHYNGISGNSFTGCTRGSSPAAHDAGTACNLLQSNTPSATLDWSYAGNWWPFKAVSYSATGTPADISSAPQFSLYVELRS